MKKLALALLIALCSAHADARPPDTEQASWRTMQTKERINRKEPTMLYFGAVWCPPCKIL